jgi:hypothetical protein
LDAVEAEALSPQHEVVHTRRVLFPNREYWVVHDHVRGERNHRFEARWHLPAEAHGRVRVVRNSKQTTVITPAGRLVVPTPIAVDIEDGWVSPSYGIKHCAPIVVLSATGIKADIVTVLSPGSAAVTMIDNTCDDSLECSVLRGDSTDLLGWTSTSDVSWERWSA